MRSNAKLKMIIDIVMTLGLLACMAYLLTGQEAHEWIGTGMFILFILHHILNFRWWKSLFKGKYTAQRMIVTAVDILTLISMLGLMVSGILMSEYVFDFIHVRGASSFSRTLHLLASYWGFVFMSLHLGLHWSVVTGRIKNIFGKRNFPPALKWVFRIIALVIAVFGAAAFIRYDLISYMFLVNHFAFLDENEPYIIFLLNYVCIMGLWVWITYYGQMLIKKRTAKRKK